MIPGIACFYFVINNTYIYLFTVFLVIPWPLSHLSYLYIYFFISIRLRNNDLSGSFIHHYVSRRKLNEGRKYFSLKLHAMKRIIYNDLVKTRIIRNYKILISNLYFGNFSCLRRVLFKKTKLYRFSIINKHKLSLWFLNMVNFLSCKESCFIKSIQLIRSFINQHRISI